MDSKVSEKEMRETYLRAFGKEFDSDDRKQPSMPLKIAYLVSLKKLRRQGKFQGGGMITENEYYHIANHFVYFCFNFNTNFVDAFKDHDYEELKSKFWLGYDEKGFYSSVIYFYSQLNKKQKLILSNWIYKNYKGEKLPKSVDSDEYFAVVNNFFDFCINYPENFLTWFGSEYDYFEAKWNDISNSSDSYSSMVKFWIELSESNRQKLVDGIVSNYKNDNDIEKKSLGGVTFPVYENGWINGKQYEVIGYNKDKDIVRVKNFSEPTAKEMTSEEWFPHTFELGTPATFKFNNRDYRGEVIMRDGKKAISLYKDDNYSGDSERIMFFDKIDLKTLRPSMKKEQFSLGGFILGAGLGVVGSYLYNNSTINKENGKIDLSIKKPKNIFKNK